MGFLLGNAGLIALFLVTSYANSFVLHERRVMPLPESALRERRPIEKNVLLPVRIGLKQNQNAESNAEKWIMDVSDPDSPNYGRYWTQDEVIQAFKPSDETIGNVTAWLHSHEISEFTHTDNQMWFAFDAPAYKVENMLQTEYFEYTTGDGAFEASCDAYSLPAHLSPHIHYITPGIRGSDVTDRTARSRPLKSSGTKAAPTRTKRDIKESYYPPYNSSTSLEHCAREVTPACIRYMYNFSIADPALPVDPTNSLGIFEALQAWYWQGDLNTFYRYFAPYIPWGTRPMVKTIDGDHYEPNVTRGHDWKAVYNGEADLDLQASLPIIYPQRVTFYEVEGKSDVVRKIPEDNFFNKFLDAVDGSYCSAAQRGNSSEGGKPQCGILKPTNVISASYGAPEWLFPAKWQERQCNEYLKLGLQGVSVFYCSQDYGVFYWYDPDVHEGGRCQHNQTGQRVFGPMFPASCPWVTAVGATQIPPGGTVYQPEVGAEWTLYYKGQHYWGGTSSGGGFAMAFDAPPYQKEAVSQYFKDYNPPWNYFYNGDWQNGTGRYNRNGRGFPDISAVGTHLATFIGNEYQPADGTSDSTPLVASLFNRIVEERLRVGKGPLGFVNPTLYKNRGALNDIIHGANGLCARDDGFKAVPGWDPVTGLGTPNFPKLLDVFMKLP